MHRIDTANAGAGGVWKSGVQLGTPKGTNNSPEYMNDEQENICRAIENEGIELVKGDYEQLSTAIQSVAGKKRNLNFNAAFAQTQSWGGINSNIAPSGVKIPSVGWRITSANTSAILAVITPAGLNLTGTASSAGMTINVFQNTNRLNDSTYGNDTLTSAGEVKKFTSSVKYKKNSGSDFTIQSYIGSISSDETIVSNVVGDSTSETTGMAYKQVTVNTQDLGTTPISGAGFEITINSGAAFDILIKNCDLVEGLTLPDFQTYSDYIADKALADQISKDYTFSGHYKGNVATNKINGASSTEITVMIPYQNSNIESGDTLTITNESIKVYSSVDNSELTVTNIIVVDETVDDALVVRFSPTITETTTPAYVSLVEFDWTWVKPAG